ncbi:MAG: hypothetical protein LBI35_01515 [Burkholderiales bacterium]|nr:hypothetical protein [Burkholderiales bacterium]
MDDLQFLRRCFFRGLEIELVLLRVVGEQVAFWRGKKQRFHRRFCRFLQGILSGNMHCAAASCRFDADDQRQRSGLPALGNGLRR